MALLFALFIFCLVYIGVNIVNLRCSQCLLSLSIAVDDSLASTF